MSNTSNDEPFIATPISRLICYIIGDEKTDARACIYLHPDDALVWQLKDPLEKWAHVEMPTKDNKLERPRLWHSKRWHESEHKRLSLIVRAQQEKHHVEMFDHNIFQVARSLCATNGLSMAENKPIAERIVRKQKNLKFIEDIANDPKELKELKETQEWSRRFTRMI